MRKRRVIAEISGKHSEQRKRRLPGSIIATATDWHMSPLRGKMRLNTEKELQRKRGGIKEPSAPAPTPEPVKVFEPSNPVTLLEIEDTGCRFVVEVRRGGESLMCNETATRKFGFCPHHSKLNYEPK